MYLCQKQPVGGRGVVYIHDRRLHRAYRSARLFLSNAVVIIRNPVRLKHAAAPYLITGIDLAYPGKDKNSAATRHNPVGDRITVRSRPELIKLIIGEMPGRLR